MKSPKGTLWRDFNHINVELSLPGKKKKGLQVDRWWGNREELATVCTVCNQARNMIKGVTLDFCYMMRSVCARFSIYVKNVFGEVKNTSPWGSDEARCCFFSVSSPER